MTEPLTAAQIVKMVHPDLPPATAHFLLNEAKPLLEWIETQAEGLANYKQLATTAIDDAAALRTQLEAFEAQSELDEQNSLPARPASADGFDSLRATSEDKTVYAAIAAQAQAMRQMKMVPLTADQIYDLAEPLGCFEFGDAQGGKRLAFARAIESAHGITGEHKLPAAPQQEQKGGE